ncbi:MAG: tandem-95 repeat protein [Rhizobiaceae bacterium]
MSKFGQTFEEIDGQVVCTVPGDSSQFEWKLTPGSSALLWTDSDYDVLDDCQQIRFNDVTVAIDGSGQITETPTESAPKSDVQAKADADELDEVGLRNEEDYSPQTPEITVVKQGATIIRVDDYVDTTGDETPLVSKAWANHGEVKINTDGTLSYLPDDSLSVRDDITFIVHDSHWSTQVMKVRIENQVPLPELGSQLIPNQFDGMDTHVSLDIGGYLADLLLDDNVTVSVTGLPPGLTYNAGRMHIEGVLNSDGGDGESYVVQVSLTAASGQVLSTQFRWIVQQERAMDAREALTRAVPPISSQSDAAAAAVLYSVASQAAMAARGLSLTQNATAAQSNSNQTASQLDIARNDLLAGESGKASLKGSEGQGLADLRLDPPIQIEEEGEEPPAQLVDSGSSSVSIERSRDDGPARTAPRSNVELEDDTTAAAGGPGAGDTNEAPFTGSPAPVSTNEDTGVLGIDVLTAAFDPDGDTISLTSASAGSGVVGINGDGTLDYVPDPDFNGTDTITYTLADGNGNSTTGSVAVNVAAVNDAPIAGTRADVSTNEDNTLSNINVLTPASDIDGDALTVSAATAVNGVVTVNADNTLNYIPNADYFGSDTINYTVSDGNGGFDSSSFAVTVNSVNDAPRPVADSDVVLEDGSVSINVLGNDTDIDGSVDPTTVQITGTASPGDSLVVAGEGTWSVNPGSGNISFTPLPDFDGSVSDISYTVADTLGARSTPIAVSVTITPVNDAPVAVANTSVVAEDSSVVINVLANDTDIDSSLDPVTVQIVGTASAGDPLAVGGEGTWSVNTTTGEITFTPEADYDGAVTDITYTVRDTAGAVSNPVAVSVSITGSNDTPVAGAVPDAGTNEDVTATSIDVLSFVTDADGDTVSVTGATASNGSVVVNPDGSLNYTPDANYNGTDTISFNLDDGNGGTSSGSVDVVVAPVNDNPVAGSTPLSNSNEDTALNNIDVLSYASDIDGDSLSVSAASAANGLVTINPDGSLNYTPNADFNGLDTVSYTVDDSNGGTAAGTKFVYVNPVNDAPVTANDSGTVPEDGSIVVNVLVNDSDVDGTLVPSTVQITGTASPGDSLIVAGEGTWSINSTTGEITFTPETDYTGSVSAITYTVEDNSGAVSSPATVSITISSVNDAPVGSNDSDTLVEDGSVIIDVLANDSDIDGTLDPATVQITGTASAGDSLVVAGEGTWSVNTTTGAITFTPEPDYAGPVTDTTYTVQDDGGATSNATNVSVSITPVNDAPVASSDTDTVLEDGSVVIDILANDNDIDGTLVPSTVQIVGTASAGDPLAVPGEGTWTVNATTGEITFTPEANYTGSVTDISYTVEDNNAAASSPTTVSVSITGINDAPVIDLSNYDNAASNSSFSAGTVANWTDWAAVGSFSTGGVAPNAPAVNYDPVGAVSTLTQTGVTGLSDGPGSNGAAMIQFDLGWNNVPGDGGRAQELTLSVGGIDYVSFTTPAGPGATTAVNFLNGASGTPASITESNYLDWTYTTIELNLPATVADTADVRFTWENLASPQFAGDDISIDNVKVIVNDANPNDSDHQVDYQNGNPAISLLDSSSSIQDTDGTTLQSAQVLLTFAESGDAFLVGGVAATNGASGTVGGLVWSSTISGGQIVVNLTGAGSHATYLAALQQIQFESNSGSPVSSTRVVDITVNDGIDDSVAAQTFINFGINDAPPSATDDVAAGFEDVALVIDVLANDTDGDFPIDPATVHIRGTTNPGDSLVVAGEGTWSINGVTGEITFTPEAEYVGTPTSIEYTVSDTSGLGSKLAQVSATIAAVNDAPVASGDSGIVTEDGAVVIDVLANDNDIDGSLVPSTVQITGTSNPGDSLVVAGEGTWSVNTTNGEITFTPETDYAGSVTDITYTVDDNGGGTSNPATASVSITPVNDAPNTVNDTDTVIEDSAVVIDILANDSDVDGTLVPSSVQIVGTSNPGDPLVVGGEGTWTVNSLTGAITFTPETNYSGPVADISYTVDDNSGATSTPATVSVSITGINDAPTANNDSDTVLEDGTVAIDVLANDTDLDGTLVPSTVQIVGTASPGNPLVVAGEGTWSVNTISGEISFTPIADYTGSVTPIAYTVQDNSGATSGSASVSVTITAVNDAPAAANDSDTVAEDGAVVIDVLANDSDVDGTLDPSTVQIGGTSNPGDSLVVAGEGTWSVNTTTGEITFTPEADFDGAVTNITYTVDDNNGATSNSATVAVVITPSNDAPYTNNDSDSVLEDGSVVIDILANDTDVDGTIVASTVQIAGTTNPGDPLVVPGEGQWTINSTTGEITFTPEADYTGSVTDITYTVQDNNGAISSPASVSVSITPVNDPPTLDLDLAQGGNDSATAYSEGAPSAAITSPNTAPVDTEDSFYSATITLDAAPDGADEFLIVNSPTFALNSDNAGMTTLGSGLQVAYVYTAASRELVLTNQAGPGDPLTNANVEEMLESLSYRNTSEDPTVGDRTFTIVLEDTSGATSLPADAAVTVYAVNDAPTASGNGGTVNEDGSLAVSVLLNDGDVDGTLNPATIQIVGTASAGDPLVVPGEGTWSVDTILGRISFTPEADYDGPVTDISYTVRDDLGAISNAATVTMSITPANDAPTAITPSGITGTSINSDGGNAAYFKPDNSGAFMGGLTAFTVQMQFTSANAVGAAAIPIFNYFDGGPSDELEITISDALSTPYMQFELGSATQFVSNATYDPSDLLDGGLHTLSMTWDNALGDWELFADGVSVASGSGLNAGYTITGTGVLTLGQEQDSLEGSFGSTQFFSGTYHDLRIFDDVRTPAEIAAGAGNEVAAAEPNLVANWQFSDGETTTVTDTVSGNNLNLQQVVGAGFTASTPSDVIAVVDDSTSGTVIATLATTDVDTGDTFSYALTSDPSGIFEIVGNELRIASGQSVDFESAASHAITIEVTDSGLATYSRNMTIEVTNVAEVNAGMAIFSNNSNQALSNEWDGTSFGSNVTGPNLGNEFRTLQVAEAPTRDEVIVVGVISSSEVRAQIWDGSSWSEVPLGKLGDVSESYWWGAEIAYEQSSGDAVMVWNDDNQSSGQQLRYATWDGSSWSPVQSVPGYAGGEPQHMKLSFDPNSDEMVLVVNDDSADDYAYVWNGSSWGNGILLDASGGGESDQTPIAVSHEADSGDAIVTYGKDSSTDIFYRVWDGASWSSESSVSAPGAVSGDPRWIVSANDLSSDRVVVGATTGGNDAWVSVWNGSSWETAVQIETNVEDLNSPNIAVAFENQSGQALVTYSEDGSDTVYYRTWDSVGGWSSEQTLVDLGNRINSMTLDSSPTSDQIMLSVQDNSQDLNYILWDGSSWGTPILLENDTGENKNQPFAFVWDQNGALATSPLAFDINLDGEINVTGETTAQNKAGIRELGATVEFDIDGDDDLETIEWLDGTGDALLVDNRDGNAANDMDGTRLFGDQGGTYEHGYQQLAEWDSNEDGVISGQEGEGLNLWVDDGDAKVDEGELFTLGELGISEIELQLEEHAVDEDGRDLFRSSATLEDGSKIMTEDVWFAQAVEEDEEQATRPDLSTVQQDDLTA